MRSRHDAATVFAVQLRIEMLLGQIVVRGDCAAPLWNSEKSLFRDEGRRYEGSDPYNWSPHKIDTIRSTVRTPKCQTPPTPKWDDHRTQF